MLSFLKTLVVAALLITIATASGWAQDKASSSELTVAAAADLSAALKEIGDGYEKKTGVKVKLSFGASGALTQQIQNGGPFDLFFSADMDYPRQLITAGDADGASLYQYAIGKLVLWVPADSPLDLDRGGMNVLLDPMVKKIAIANPQHAPYGRAAVAALKHAGLYDRVADRLVMGENVSQAAQFAESGNAQAGFVALPTESVYCMTKAAIAHLTKCLAVEWGKYNITVNAVAPTFIRTPGTESCLANSEFHSDVIERIAALHRIGDPMDVAGVVVFLASRAASLITGETILIDGGWTAR